MRLTFPNGEHAAVNIEHGQIGVGSASGGGTAVTLPGLAPLHAVFANGRRGRWLTVPHDAKVMVNARPVKRVAFLRCGDMVCLGSVQVRIESDVAPAEMQETPSTPMPRRRSAEESLSSSKAVLRGLSGPWFGRCLSLSVGRVIGSGAGVDIRLDGQGVQERHALVDLEEGRVVVRALSPGAGLRVNGHTVRVATLITGDQLELGEQRFVLEAPGFGAAPLPPTITPVPGARAEATTGQRPAVSEPIPAHRVEEPSVPPRDLGGVYLLIAAAAALAAALTAFFVYAPRG